MRKNAKLPKTVGRKIKRIRKKNKLTQEKLAEKAGISTTYMGFIEQGRYAPSLGVLDKISKTLRVKIGELLS